MKSNLSLSRLVSSHLVGHVVQTVQVRVNHSHQLLQRLRLELAHGEDPLVQPRAGSCPQGFLEENTNSGVTPYVRPGVTSVTSQNILIYGLWLFRDSDLGSTDHYS